MMPSLYVLPILLISLWFPLISGAAVQNVVPHSAGCNAVCEKTYPLHTYPSNEDLASCQRGCQMSSFVHYMNDAKNSSVTLRVCGAACERSHNLTSEIYACQLGCSYQDAITAESEHETTTEIAEEMSPMENETSNGNAFNVQGMLEKMSNLFSTSWILFIADEDGKASLYESPQDIMEPESDVHQSPTINEGWFPYQNDMAGKGWLQKNGTPVACFYDFLHFLFFKIIVLFLIFLFILTVLTLMRITIFDMSKKPPEYVSFIEPPSHLGSIPHTKLDV